MEEQEELPELPVEELGVMEVAGLSGIRRMVQVEDPEVAEAAAETETAVQREHQDYTEPAAAVVEEWERVDPLTETVLREIRV